MKKLVEMSIIATTGMTLASFVISAIRKKKSSPPKALNQMIYPEKQPERANRIEGYLLYWLIGLGFSTVYKAIWDKSVHHPNASSGLALGFLNGVKGVARWHVLLKTHPSPPSIKLKPFYLQLLGAHVLFGYLHQMVIKKNTKNT